ncbi:glycosyltransferase [Collinsella sp. AGMB00827]|uniref:Glycosyltransferase n=1 Tax=Collinsella ureilytica TaxID=2869515 RepID=A0ABS7MIZ7_9ACTN|nr:glycosyltransferase [Collinsella urealyticum]MBY4797003.1 glycosyltransferase [Collinsella urealyticum]
MGAPLVSIIMPCYRVAKDLPAAIRCVQAQTVTNWELIAVDDGSPDRVGAILEAAAERDTRIRKLCHEKNRGLSAARNTGLAAARGSFIWMPDPDDCYDPDFLELALAELTTDDAPDLAIFGYTEVLVDEAGNQQASRAILPATVGTYAGAELHALVLGLEEATLLGFAWNKVYRRDVLRDLLFEDAPLIEDILFNIAVLDRAHAACLLRNAPYHYAKRVPAALSGKSLTGRFEPAYFDLHYRRVQELYNQQRRWGLDGADTRARLGVRLTRYIMSALERNCDPRSGMSASERLAWARKVRNDPLVVLLVRAATGKGGRLARWANLLVRLGEPHLMLLTGRVLHVMRTRAARGFGAVIREEVG